MDTAHWPHHQEMVVKPMEEIVVVQSTTTSKPATSSSNSLERKVRPQKDQALNCPRCNSTNTKFCYYNNYSLSQPRYFCKTCRRYWTAGGSLRNIPVGGGSRKNKRSSSSTPSNSISSSKKINNPDLVVMPPASIISHQNPNHKIYGSNNGGTTVEVQDLNLGFPSAHDFKTISELIQVPNFEHNNNNKENMPSSSSTTNSSQQLSALELLTGMTSSSRGGLSSFMPMPVADPNGGIYPSSGSSMFSLPPELKPSSLNFSLDGLGSAHSNSHGGGFGSLSSHHHHVQDHESSGGRLLFPFEDLNLKNHNHHQVSTTSTTTNNNAPDDVIQQNKDHHQNAADSTNYWNGVFGGGTW